MNQIDLEPIAIVTEEVAERLARLQPRCLGCGSMYAIHIHHRLFRSEQESGVRLFLESQKEIFRQSYNRELVLWTMHSIQNLVRLCRDCHEGDGGRGVHGGNTKLRLFFRFSFTCPVTGFNVPFYKFNSLY